MLTRNRTSLCSSGKSTWKWPNSYPVQSFTGYYIQQAKLLPLYATRLPVDTWSTSRVKNVCPEEVLQELIRATYLNDQIIPRLRAGVCTTFLSAVNQCCAMLRSLVSFVRGGSKHGELFRDRCWQLRFTSNIQLGFYFLN
jgi:hypothetical protein